MLGLALLLILELALLLTLELALLLALMLMLGLALLLVLRSCRRPRCWRRFCYWRSAGAHAPAVLVLLLGIPSVDIATQPP